MNTVLHLVQLNLYTSFTVSGEGYCKCGKRTDKERLLLLTTYVQLIAHVCFLQ